ncbi:IlvD/Edd family dehydratase [Bowmanella yangjiangensis]|uniref:Dihydroxy-acid dehydratase family protein n=1 Tax=Bowmanella yangjiangensis TaxID=2811230 RepID=A0ABS3CQD6_9ALTE|nr:IlvD/Edd family dehydratase [Bowmanella yangjiangensis]MBN7818666.1 dihydroxy-acid dehydratase family protein [Bowmanella yangjiangensis]
MKKDISLRSRAWFNDDSNPDMTALYLEKYLNYGLTIEELQGGKPIIGIAQTGSDLVPCNRAHIELAERLKAGIRDAGGIPIEFPVHPIQETGRRPTAALDRNLQCLSLIEVLHGYPIDAVVLTTGCDKTTPALLMGAASVNIPAIAYSVGPMLNGRYKGQCVGSGTIIWDARKRLAKGDIDYNEFIAEVASSAPSTGHCNTMGTALTMNCLAEALGMMLPGCASIPAPYRERAQMAYHTGKRIVDMVWEDLTPEKILTREAFENAIRVCSALGGSTNAPIHINAIAAHAGVDVKIQDWQSVGQHIPQLVNCQPVGKYLSEDFHNAGGLPAVIGQLLQAGLLNAQALTVTGKSIGENCHGAPLYNSDVIYEVERPLKAQAGLMVLSGNLFDSAIMKVSAIDPDFRQRYLSNPANPNCFTARAIVFNGPEEYHSQIDNPELDIDENCILVMRYTGPKGYPGSAEVVNMQPPKALLARGISSLPTMGDGRQSGTSGSPSILNASPEAADGGGLALLRTGDLVQVDLNQGRVNVQISNEELAERRAALDLQSQYPANQTWWQEIYRAKVSNLDEGAVFVDMLKYSKLRDKLPRHSH